MSFTFEATRQADEKALPACKEAVEAYNPSEEVEIALPKLCRLAEVASVENSQWSSALKKLDVLQVDEDLLSHVREEIAISGRTVNALMGIAKSSVAFRLWQKKKSATPDNIIGDMLDSFFQGMMGRPFAGYEKIKADAAKLDTEGQQIVETCLFYQQSLASSWEESERHSLKEHQLRSELSKRYGVEFTPRPE